MNQENEKMLNTSSSELLLSCMFAVVTVLLLLSSSTMMSIIKPRLYDGSINELGRYSMTFDAYEYIEKNSDSAVIAIGSSKMRDAFDGQLLGELHGGEYDFYNIALAGDRPFVRMLEIDAIIAAQPEFIILEIGPNTFSSLGAIGTPGPIISRMAQLVSIGDVNLEQYPDYVLNNSIKEQLPTTSIERVEYLSSYVPQALEDTIGIELLDLEQPYACSGANANVRCVPLPSNSTYDDYLRYPVQFRNSLASIKAGTHSISLDEFYGSRLDTYVNRSYHNPEGIVNENQIAFEYMIERFTSAGIEIILVGLPYNPVMLNRLSIGQWDYYNTTIATYEDLDMVYVVDMMWDNDWIDDHFNDYTHMSREGEIRFSEKLIQQISPILDGD
tara:strand:- start:138 stop:1295 length:1158 start_codon:yes stop_codon:yes gene_type:complete